MGRTTSKVSIIGCGNVGMRYAYAVLIKNLARELVLVDVDKERLEGDVMDLHHAVPFTDPVSIIAGGYEDISESDLIVITAGKNQKPGQTRLDVMKENIEIFKKIIPKINQNSPESILLVVSNPVDVMSYAAYKLSARPSSAVLGSGTTLDTARLKSRMAQHCEVDARNVHTYILGEHGDSEFAVWSSTFIGGMLFKDFCDTCNRKDEYDLEKYFKEDLFKQVKESAYEIIDKKGETSYGIGLSLARISEAILDNENSILPVSTLVNGYLGINDLYISLPCIINSSGVREIVKIKMVDQEKEQFKKSAKIIRENLDKLNI